MEKLDQTYLNHLVTRASAGNSNAFAELFAAVSERHFRYLSYMLEDEEQIKQAVKQVYIRLLHSLPRLNKPVLFMPYSCRICFRYCSSLPGHEDTDRIVETPAGRVAIGQLISLPLTESQMMIMRYDQGLEIKQISQILNFDKNVVRQCLKSGLRHLQKNRVGEGGRINQEIKSAAAGKPEWFRPDPLTGPKILEEVFEACGVEPNTVPMEALSAYVVYRRERFSLQRGILAAAIILFLLLPLLFFLPKFEVEAVDKGQRGLPVYTITVTSVLPVGKVKALLKNHELPVYEENEKRYMIEPIRNGEMTLEVELVNKQSVKTVCEVTEVDNKGPSLNDSHVEEGLVLLNVEDAGIGVDFREIYAVSASGALIRPLSVNPETGDITFSYPDEKWDVYIPDHIGNMLHLTFTFE